MSLLKSLIASIGHWFATLWGNTQSDFNNLPPDQQDAIIKGVNISEIIKNGISQGADYVVNQIAEKTGVSKEVAEATFLAVAKDLGIDTTSLQAAGEHIADKVQSTITDNSYNALWQDIAQFAATYLSTGRLSWVTLGMGLVEFAYQRFIKGVK